MKKTDTQLEKINERIKEGAALGFFETNDISDGYHTFGELYEHRIALFITLCNNLYAIASMRAHYDERDIVPWKSKLHHDGTMFDGWFIAGIGKKPSSQISYHLPIKEWEKLRVVAYDKAPEWDGHRPADVVERLLKL